MFFSRNSPAPWNRGFRGALLLAALVFAGVCPAQNLVSNPGFESGDTAGWTGFGAVALSVQTTTVHAGSYAALVQNRTATWNGLAQSLQAALQPGQVYHVSAWVRLADAGSETVQLTMKKVDADGDGYAAIASGTVSADGWTQLSGQYALAVSGVLTSLTFYVEVPSSATASFYVDDLDVEPANSGGTGTNGASFIDAAEVHQRIDGFGASSAWRSSWSASAADKYFSTNNGIGLSLLRTRIAPGGTTVEGSIMQMARDRGARVWSSPWSPATPFKSNTNVNGGSFVGNPVNYQAYAAQLAGYVANMKSQLGVTLYALSVQNEPDANVTNYESCNWTAQQIHDFVPYLRAALVASNVGATQIMLPESQNWTDPRGLAALALNDPNVLAAVGIVANHNYVPDNQHGDQAPPAALATQGRALWETEVSTFNAYDGSITNGIYWAERIHAFLTVAQANAWHYWWLSAYGSDNSGLANNSDALAKRAYVVGQFSRFVRPDFYRIGVVTNSGGALVSAFKDSVSPRFAIVAINPGTNAIEQTFTLAHLGVVTSVTPWITSAALSLAGQAAVTVSNATFAYSLPPMSVVTFVGQAATNTAPTLAAETNVVVDAGVNVVVTNLAMDPDVPPQTLAYTLVQAPTNTVLNPATGVLTWRPPVSRADSTNLITIRVSDNGSPSLSDTNSFTVIVKPLSEPTLEPAEAAGGGVQLRINGTLGPDYTLQTSTDLVNWLTLLTTNPVAMPFDLTDTNAGDAARFYRLRLGP
jgi:glucuronoarabinoxylan endo-1,4-beta-xylanase